MVFFAANKKKPTKEGWGTEMERREVKNRKFLTVTFIIH
jgi:hypothetical protein